MSFLVDLRTKQTEGAHVKAIGVFGKAIAKFEKAIAQAQASIQKNDVEMSEHHNEIQKRATSNTQIGLRVKAMEQSINKIKHIVGDV